MTTEDQINNIESRHIVGNAYIDSDLMREIHLFILDERTPMPFKIRALKKLDQVMGVESDVAEADVFAYIREFGGVVSGLLQEIEGV